MWQHQVVYQRRKDSKGGGQLYTKIGRRKRGKADQVHSECQAKKKVRTVSESLEKERPS